jgi:N6-L-threonylcarbamoyladenine synthase
MGINHLEGHMYSFLATKNIKLGDAFPGICLLVSGGHTLLMHMRSLIKWNIIGTTLDDAVGESYDKVARLIDLPYPGGPEIEKLAKDGDPNTVTFPRPMMHHKNYDFSFSGLKTAVLYFVKKRVRKTQKFKTDVAASFQAAAIDVLTHKTKLAIEAHNARSLVLAGGVAGNKTLRGALNALAKEKQITFFVPEGTLNTDNAAMIGMAAYIKALQGKKRGLPLRAEGNLSL